MGLSSFTFYSVFSWGQEQKVGDKLYMQGNAGPCMESYDD